MRLATLADRAVLLVEGGAVDIATASNGRFGTDPMAVLDDWAEFKAWAEKTDLPAATPFRTIDLTAPVPRPRQVFAVALNYRPHAAEAGHVAPEIPLLFTKFPSCIAGPHAEVELPDGNVDWELEMVAVIGRACHRVPADEAWEAVAGLTVGQDLSERRLQLTGKPAQFSLGKSYPRFGPTGPALVTPDELADRDDVAIECLLNGERVQAARTSEMIFSVPQLIEFISAVCPLYPGDLIFTGTPSGVGNRRVPQRFLGPDDVLVSRIEGLGELRQTFRSKRK
ncbi:fumarylacetoacetate hydrolase family protein [Streptomyces shenzhenensis]|uniref:fumarylacetoacetate hydrolase family protein n=1 Tax=Streptomyces shenzhenensis TaxID=943815 RepID=UPI0015F08D95|nr:fumarylacetoacetate hydrolase family protein [Streptomyces shenzhenensis]